MDDGGTQSSSRNADENKAGYGRITIKRIPFSLYPTHVKTG